MGTESVTKHGSRRAVTHRKRLIIFALAVVLCYLHYVSNHNLSDNASSQRNQMEKMKQRCTSKTSLSETANSMGTDQKKPIWLAQFPSTLVDSVHRDLIMTLTGLSESGKSFYSSRSGLRHCIDESSMSVTCSVSHPTVPLDEGFLTKHKNDYQNATKILLLRNPMTVFPFHNNEKQIKYHGLQHGEQSTIESWRDIRDTYFEKMLDEWVSTITVWEDPNIFTEGIYISYESFACPINGPQTFETLSKEFQTLGFPVVTTDKNKLSCLWYQFITKNKISSQYEYNTYIPGYTLEQKQLMVGTLDGLIQKYSSKDELVKILKWYREDIKKNCLLDSSHK